MPDTTDKCYRETVDHLITDGFDDAMISSPVKALIMLACGLGASPDTIAPFISKLFEWKSILESIEQYGLSEAQIENLKNQFFNGNADMTETLDRAKEMSIENIQIIKAASSSNNG